MDKPNCWVKKKKRDLTQWLGLSIFYPYLGWNNPAPWITVDVCTRL